MFTTRFQFQSALPHAEIRRRLQAATLPKKLSLLEQFFELSDARFAGQVGESTFDLKPQTRRNSNLVVVQGEYYPLASGTVVKVRIYPHPLDVVLISVLTIAFAIVVLPITLPHGGAIPFVGAAFVAFHPSLCLRMYRLEVRQVKADIERILAGPAACAAGSTT